MKKLNQQLDVLAEAIVEIFMPIILFLIVTIFIFGIIYLIKLCSLTRFIIGILTLIGILIWAHRQYNSIDWINLWRKLE